MRLKDILLYCSYGQSSKYQPTVCPKLATILLGNYRYPYCDKHPNRSAYVVSRPVSYIFPFSDAPPNWLYMHPI